MEGVACTYDQAVVEPSGARMSRVAKNAEPVSPVSPVDVLEAASPVRRASFDDGIRSPKSRVGDRTADALRSLAESGGRRPRPRRRKKGAKGDPSAADAERGLSPIGRLQRAPSLDTFRLDEFEKKSYSVDAEVVRVREDKDDSFSGTDWLMNFMGCSVGCVGSTGFSYGGGGGEPHGSRSSSWDGTDLDPESDSEVITDVELFVVANQKQAAAGGGPSRPGGGQDQDGDDFEDSEGQGESDDAAAETAGTATGLAAARIAHRQLKTATA